MPLKPSSKAWMREHVTDPFVHLAQKEGFRARAVYKLKEMNEKWRLFFPGASVVDLGAAPGSWAQYTAKELKGTGKIIALDILPMQALPHVEFLQCDFSTAEGLFFLKNALKNQPADLILSDMSPNLSGIKDVDQSKSVYLAELALDCAQTLLQKKGGLVLKVFQGSAYNAFFNTMCAVFQRVERFKPKASRPRSPEVYLYGRNLK